MIGEYAFFIFLFSCFLSVGNIFTKFSFVLHLKAAKEARFDKEAVKKFFLMVSGWYCFS